MYSRQNLKKRKLDPHFAQQETTYNTYVAQHSRYTTAMHHATQYTNQTVVPIMPAIPLITQYTPLILHQAALLYPNMPYSLPQHSHVTNIERPFHTVQSTVPHSTPTYPATESTWQPSLHTSAGQDCVQKTRGLVHRLASVRLRLWRHGRAQTQLTAASSVRLDQATLLHKEHIEPAHKPASWHAEARPTWRVRGIQKGDW